MSNLREHDEWAAELWSDDPDVEITDAPLDANAPHGANSDAEVQRPARLSAAVARLKARLR